MCFGMTLKPSVRFPKSHAHLRVVWGLFLSHISWGMLRVNWGAFEFTVIGM